jgi:hypothetical protein
MEGPVDTTDIPGRAGPFVAQTCDARGNLPRRHGPIREAVIAKLRRRKVSG